MKTQKRKLTIVPGRLVFKKVKLTHYTGMRHTWTIRKKKGYERDGIGFI